MSDLTPEALAAIPYRELEEKHVAYLQQLDLDGLTTVICEALAQEPPNETLVAAIGGMGIGAFGELQGQWNGAAFMYGAHLIAQLRLNERLGLEPPIARRPL
jgi:hypothetical protein